jgi:acyl phosphate:glycerol-3-phosphate acyltransferase
MATYLSAPVLLALGLGYLLGAIPFGLLLTRAAGLGDIRKMGSGNIGATNVLRTGHKGLAGATLLLDVLKGAGAVLMASWLSGGAAAIAAGFGAFLGHIFPVWLGFKGGKGVATYIGVLLGLHWPAALGFCSIWLAVALATRYSSLSALIASVVTPFILWVLDKPDLALVIAGLTVLLFAKHTANIKRLLAGQESKIGAKSLSGGFS